VGLDERAIVTARLELRAITLPIFEAVWTGDRVGFEQLMQASLPKAWPNRALIERAFTASPEGIRADPEGRLWGDRLMITRSDPRRCIGSVVFHGKPDESGLVEVGYGVDDGSQGQGLATEAVRAAIEWAAAQPGVRVISATTFPLHIPSIRVLEKCGMRRSGFRDHELLGELLVFELSCR
jgi:ribosomal-protein-alanine N-acetyltransferase